MIRWIWAILVSICLVANAQEGEQYLLTDVSYEVAGRGFQLGLTFDRPYPEKKANVELINHTIQINLPGGYYKPGKSSKRVKGKKIRSVFTYQVNSHLLRSRIIYFPNYLVKNLEGLVQIKSKGKALLIKVQDSNLAVTQMPNKKLPIVPPIDLNSELGQVLSKVVPEDVDVFEPAKESAEDIIKKDMSFPLTLPPKEKVEEVAKVMTQKKLVIEKNFIGKSDNKEPKKPLDESEIPILTKSEVKKGSSYTSSLYWRAVLSLLVILIFAGVLVVGAKYWTKNRIGVQNQNKIRMLTQYHLGPKKSLAIVQVSGESILIGITDHSINLIKTLSLLDEEIPEEAPQSFLGELGRVETEVPPPETKVQDQVNLQSQLEISKPIAEEFSYGKIQRQVADRLKKMRSL